jgi:hypothetical protein
MIPIRIIIGVTEPFIISIVLIVLIVLRISADSLSPSSASSSEYRPAAWSSSSEYRPTSFQTAETAETAETDAKADAKVTQVGRMHRRLKCKVIFA